MMPQKKEFWYQKIRKPLLRILQASPSELDPFEAYQFWAETYDDIENNALLFAEQSVIQPMLDQLSLKGKVVLDAGCGTGRYIQVLQQFQPRTLVGVDFAPNMLERARLKEQNNLSVQFQVAEIEHLPFDADAFDFVISTLVLDHIKNLTRAVAELARVLRSNGTLIISSFHPYGKLLGWQRTFKADRKGSHQQFAVKYYAHRHADYFSAFEAAGLKICRMIEPMIDQSLEPFYKRAGRLDLYERYKGFPLLLIFQLQKQ